jgi:hypothetical protein
MRLRVLALGNVRGVLTAGCEENFRMASPKVERLATGEHTLKLNRGSEARHVDLRSRN